MWLKILVSVLFLSMLIVAFAFEPLDERKAIKGSDSGNKTSVPLRLMTWNLGYGNLEPDTRAHSEDLAAVAQVILSNDPDAVAIQELTGEDQMKSLLAHLKNRYHGFVSKAANADRVAGVLIKDRHNDNLRPRFADLPAGDSFAAAATFRWNKDLPEILLLSAHADAFRASRRRIFLADVVDRARRLKEGQLAFVAGDLNFEVNQRKPTDLFTDDAKHDSESYAYFLKHFNDLGREAGETAVNNRRIDYVFGPLKEVSLRRAEVLRGTTIGRMDHWPLLVEISF